jgi:hypothetical protein
MESAHAVIRTFICDISSCETGKEKRGQSVLSSPEQAWTDLGLGIVLRVRAQHQSDGRHLQKARVASLLQSESDPKLAAVLHLSSLSISLCARAHLPGLWSVHRSVTLSLLWQRRLQIIDEEPSPVDSRYLDCPASRVADELRCERQLAEREDKSSGVGGSCNMYGGVLQSEGDAGDLGRDHVFESLEGRGEERITLSHSSQELEETKLATHPFGSLRERSQIRHPGRVGREEGGAIVDRQLNVCLLGQSVEVRRGDEAEREDGFRREFLVVPSYINMAAKRLLAAGEGEN